MTIYILSHRFGTEMYKPIVFKTEEEANEAADNIMEDILSEAYHWAEDSDADMTFGELVKWAEDSGSGDSRYFWDGDNDATEIMITEAEV